MLTSESGLRISRGFLSAAAGILFVCLCGSISDARAQTVHDAVSAPRKTSEEAVSAASLRTHAPARKAEITPQKTAGGNHSAASSSIPSSEDDDLSAYGSWHFSSDDESGGGFSVLSTEFSRNSREEDLNKNAGAHDSSGEAGKTSAPLASIDGESDPGDDVAVLLEDEIVSGPKVVVDAYGNRVELRPGESVLEAGDVAGGQGGARIEMVNSVEKASTPKGTRIVHAGEGGADIYGENFPSAEAGTLQQTPGPAPDSKKEESPVFSGPCADIQRRIHRRRIWLEARRTEQFARGGAPNAQTGIPDVTWQWCEAHPDDEECRMPPVTVFFTTEELQGGRLPEDYDRHIILMKRELAKCLHREKGVR